SEKGAKLVYLLTFISKYNDFAESIAKQNALLQMHKSLNRFNEVKVLPPQFLSNLYPFNSRKRFTHNYFNYTLGSNSEEVTRFFFEEFNSETTELNDKFFETHSIPAYQKSDYQEKLNVVLNKLNNSLVHHF